MSWEVGERGIDEAMRFAGDLRRRLASRVQVTTDGHTPYLNAIEDAFGADVDYARLVKQYDGRDRYIGAIKGAVSGSPRMEDASTSHVERLNLTLRMGMRRFTRRTNAFSKKVENHRHMVALYSVFYNFIRVHGTLGTTPAVAAGLAREPYSMKWLIDLVEAYRRRRAALVASNQRPLILSAS